LNESDLDLDGGSSCTSTPIHLSNSHNTRRINSETNLNESQKRLSGFMGNKSKRIELHASSGHGKVLVLPEI
jgi:hypothetical protein